MASNGGEDSAVTGEKILDNKYGEKQGMTLDDNVVDNQIKSLGVGDWYHFQRKDAFKEDVLAQRS